MDEEECNVEEKEKKYMVGEMTENQGLFYRNEYNKKMD